MGMELEMGEKCIYVNIFLLIVTIEELKYFLAIF